MRVTSFILSVGLCVLCALPSVASAQESGTFQIYVRGFKFGTISYSAVVSGNAYSTAARVEATGLIGALKRTRYDAKSQGTLSSGRFVPQAYQERAQKGDRNTSSVMNYARGVPGPKVRTPPREPRDGELNPATQGGTLDPSTAVFAAMGDMTSETACKVDISMFDGRYRARIQINQPRPDGDGLICSGAYTRVAGYSEKEMNEGSRFPFTARYAPGPDGKLRMTAVEMDTIYGNARVERR